MPINKKVEEATISYSANEKFLLKKRMHYNGKVDKYGLNRYFTLPIPQDKRGDANYINAILEKLGKNHNIEVIYPFSKPVSWDVSVKKHDTKGLFSRDDKNNLQNQSTHSSVGGLTTFQYYMNGPDILPGFRVGGIGAVNVHKKFPNTSQGQGIKILSYEDYHWNAKHIDLPKVSETFGYVAEDEHDKSRGHNTAVIGIMAAKGIEMKGIVNQAQFGFGTINDLEDIIGETLTAGDVLQSSIGSGANGPMEHYPEIFDIFSTATDKGIHVVLAAGNSQLNLDDPKFDGKFDRDVRDSGAIYVASVCSTDGKITSSNFGSRIDFASWGGCSDVATTTSKNFQLNRYWNYGVDAQYANANGTSFSGPIVAGVVASISGYAKSKGITISPKEMRDLVTKTGTPFTHNDNVKNYIGTHPNLEKALSYIDQQLLGVEPLLVPYAGTWYVSDRAKFANKNGKHSSVYFNIQDEAGINGNLSVPKGSAITGSKWEGYNRNNITVWVKKLEDNSIHPLALTLARTTDCRGDYHINTGVTCDSATPTNSGFAVKVNEGQTLPNGTYKTEFWVDVKGWHDPTIKNLILVDIAFKI